MLSDPLDDLVRITDTASNGERKRVAKGVLACWREVLVLPCASWLPQDPERDPPLLSCTMPLLWFLLFHKSVLHFRKGLALYTTVLDVPAIAILFPNLTLMQVSETLKRVSFHFSYNSREERYKFHFLPILCHRTPEYKTARMTFSPVSHQAASPPLPYIHCFTIIRHHLYLCQTVHDCTSVICVLQYTLNPLLSKTQPPPQCWT